MLARSDQCGNIRDTDEMIVILIRCKKYNGNIFNISAVASRTIFNKKKGGYKKDIVYHGSHDLRVHEDDPLRMEIFPENRFLNEPSVCHDFLRLRLGTRDCHLYFLVFAIAVHFVPLTYSK